MNASVTSLPVFLYMDYGCAIVATDFATLPLPLIDLLWQVIEGVGLVLISSNSVVLSTCSPIENSMWTDLRAFDVFFYHNSHGQLINSYIPPLLIHR